MLKKACVSSVCLHQKKLKDCIMTYVTNTTMLSVVDHLSNCDDDADTDADDDQYERSSERVNVDTVRSVYVQC